MTILEILDFKTLQNNVRGMKLDTKRQAEQAQAAQARLKIQKAQQQLNNLSKLLGAVSTSNLESVARCLTATH